MFLNNQRLPIYNELTRYKLTLSDVARHLGLSYTHTSNILNGRAKLRPEQKKKIEALVSDAREFYNEYQSKKAAQRSSVQNDFGSQPW